MGTIYFDLWRACDILVVMIFGLHSPSGCHHSASAWELVVFQTTVPWVLAQKHAREFPPRFKPSPLNIQVLWILYSYECFYHKILHTGTVESLVWGVWNRANGWMACRPSNAFLCISWPLSTISDGTLPGWLAGSCSGWSDIIETSKDSKLLDNVMFVPTERLRFLVFKRTCNFRRVSF